MEFPRQITVIQATIILVSTIIGVGVLALPRFAVEAVDTGAPLATFLGMTIASVGLWTITKLGMRFPDKSIIEYSEDILGRWLAFIGSVCIIIFFAVFTALTSREFGEVVITAVLRETPLEVTVIIMLMLATVASRNSITTFAYIHHFYLPAIMGPALLIIALSLKNAKTLYLRPIWGNEPGGMLTGSITIAALFQAFFVYTVVIPAMRRPERAMKATFWGMFMAGGLYILVVTATLAVFGSEEIKNLLWPTLELAKMTSLPGEILERLDAAFLAIWVTAVFTTLFSGYYLTLHAISKLFRLRDHKMLSLFILPFVFIIAMLPQNILQMYIIIETVGRIGLLITIVYPIILFILSLIRKKGTARSASSVSDDKSRSRSSTDDRRRDRHAEQ